MLTTPPLAPKTLAALKELGIYTLEDLQKIGAVRAFLLLKASGLTVTKSTLWQLAALVSGVDVGHVSEERKTELGEALKKSSACCRFPFAKRYGSLYAAGDRTGQTIGGIGRGTRWRGHRMSRQGNCSGT